MKFSCRVLTVLLSVASISSCCVKDGFVRVRDAHFVQDGKRLSYVGANFWYGAILASEGQGGDRARLCRELDTLKGLGITNLRVLVGADGPDGQAMRTTPTLQKSPGEYNDTLLRGLDYLLSQMAQRDMKAVLYLNNAWEWSGGYGCYLEWAGVGEALLPAVDGYHNYVREMAKFSTSAKARELFYSHIRNIVGRTNTVTGKPYKDDPAVFSWQICNEPRCFSSEATVQDAFVEWIAEAAAVIKSVDPNHMVCTGSEGAVGCEGSYELYERVHDCPDIDYLTIHIWPYNWSWVAAPDPEKNVQAAIDSTKKYMERHVGIADRLRKPIVVEEFGFPRDGMHSDGSAGGRDLYYRTILDKILECSLDGGVYAGLNFWGWSGFAAKQPDSTMWAPGMDYCADPGQEPQGLNGVYVSDTSTTSLIERTVRALSAR